MNPFLHDFIQAGKSTAADKQNFRGIHTQHFLLRMFASALRRNRRHRTFDQFQQCLLYAFARYVTGNGRIFRFTGDFIDFVDINNPLFRFCRIVFTVLQQALNDIFNVFAHITGFRQSCCVRHGKRYVQHTRHRFRQQSFTAAGRTDKQNITFTQFHIIGFMRRTHPFVMVINRYRQHFFGIILPDDIIVQMCANFMGRRQLLFDFRRLLLRIFLFFFL